MSIGATVKRFANQRIKVSRFVGFYDAARFEKRLDSAFEISANVQPARAADLQQVPEGYRKQGAFWVTPKGGDELRTGSAPVTPGGDFTVADEVEHKGIRYAIVAVDDWRRHSRYLAARAQQ